MIVRILILLGLVKLLDATDSPIMCTVIYIAAYLFIGLIAGVGFSSLIISLAVGGALAYLYFWLLHKYKDTGVLWWVICIGGAFVGLV